MRVLWVELMVLLLVISIARIVFAASPSYYPTTSPNSVNIISTYAGSGSYSFSGDNGYATSASLADPHGLVIDSSNNIIFSDRDNCRIRKITASTSMITTLVGTGSCTFSGDGGSASSAEINRVNALAIDKSDNYYIADQNNNRIRKVTASTNIITTIAGTGSNGYSGDNGAATAASLNYPAGVAIDLTGYIYISDTSNNRIRLITVATGVITTIAGTGSAGYSGDGGQATSAQIQLPHGITFNSNSVYFGDWDGYNVIRKVNLLTGIITTAAGTGGSGYNGDNIAATSATLYRPHDVYIDAYGNMFISDCSNNRVRKVSAATGLISTIAGTGSGSTSGDNGVATSAGVYCPSALKQDSYGNYYVAETSGNRIRKISTTASVHPMPSQSFSASDAVTSSVSSTSSDVVVYSTGSYGSSSISKSTANALFNGIFYRKCSTSGSSPCDSEHSLIYYKRLTCLPSSFSIYDNMLTTWSSTNNVLNTDFKLYSSYTDLVNDVNSWTYCNYDDTGVGAFRDCGLSGYVAMQWVSFSVGGTRSDYAFYLVNTTGTSYYRSTCTNSPTFVPSKVPTTSPTPPPTVTPTATPSFRPSTIPTLTPRYYLTHFFHFPHLITSYYQH